MIRVLHRWPGLLALALVTVLALSGAALSVFPAVERLAGPQAEAGLTAATLADRILAVYPGLEQIRRAPSGQITAYWFDQGAPGAAVIDPATGQGVASADPNLVERWLTNLHRSLFLGDGGRIAMAAGAAAMLVLSLSGAALVARRAGGWRHWFAPLRGPLVSRLHVEIARIAVIGLVLSSTTALWMTASTFELLPELGAMPAFPAEVSGKTGVALGQVPTLLQTPVAELRGLSFPYPGDATDVFTLRTDRGTGYLDQGTGVLLGWAALTGWERVSETIYMLHTGQGAATLGLVLGFMALCVPALGATGILIWLAGRRGRPRIRGNHPAGRAADIPLAVLGFGDRSFPAYCAFAKAAARAAGAKGWPELLPLDTVDRQSPQDFARWGRTLGQALGIPLELSHQPVLPVTESLTLVSRRDHGAEVQAPTAILRFALPHVPLWQRLTRAGFAGFAVGDLIGVLPEGSAVPRFYSLASARRDGFIEIVVKKHPGGLCSRQLTALAPGDTVTAFVRRNPGFRPGRGRVPLILIGAGTGIGPLAGFVRGNTRQRPVHLFFGMRHEGSDFFYGEEMVDWQAEGRLTRLVTAVSRGARPLYVQDALRGDAAQVTQLIRDGARVMVCGGRDMAAGVADALAEILAPTGLTPAVLKVEGRYVEDVY